MRLSPTRGPIRAKGICSVSPVSGFVLMKLRPVKGSAGSGGQYVGQRGSQVHSEEAKISQARPLDTAYVPSASSKNAAGQGKRRLPSPHPSPSDMNTLSEYEFLLNGIMLIMR